MNHTPFDGKVEDAFQNTSLHLSFTGAEAPVDLGAYGDRIAEASYVESRVSVHDRGEWVADLDVLGMFLGRDFHRISPAQSCQHGQKDYDSQVLPLLTMDSWTEFLDPPPQPSIVQAHQNWLARLAAASIAI